MRKLFSELVEGNDVNRLNIILKLFNLLLDIISGDLGVLNSGTDLDLEDTVGDGLLLPLSLPEETVHLDGKNFFSESIQVCFFTPWFNFPDDQRLGDGGSLLLLRLSLLSLSFHGSGSRTVILLTIVSEWIEFIFSSSGSRGFCSLSVENGGGDDSVTGPLSHNFWAELRDHRVPCESVGVRDRSWRCCLDLFKCCAISSALFLTAEPLMTLELDFKRVVSQVDSKVGNLREHNLSGCSRCSSGLGFGRLLGLLLLGSSRLVSSGLATLSTFTTLLGTLSFTLLLFGLGLEEGVRRLLIVWHEIESAHERTKGLWHINTLFSLVVLEDAAHSASSGAHGSVKHVDIHLVVGVLEGISRLKSTRLVISAVGARDKLSKGIVAWEPSLKIILHGGSIVELTRDNVNDLVGETETLVEFFRGADHAVEFVPRLGGVTVNELLDLLELMDAEDTPNVTTVGASLLTEAGGDTSVSERQVSRLNPLLHVQSRDGLLGSCDQIERLVVIGSLNLVQVFREVRKLASLLHNGFLHEERRLDLSVLGLAQHGHTVADQGLVELHAKTFEVVAAMASDARSTLHL